MNDLKTWKCNKTIMLLVVLHFDDAVPSSGNLDILTRIFPFGEIPLLGEMFTHDSVLL